MEEEFDFSDVAETEPLKTRGVLSYLNPSNWGVTDYTKEPSFEDAFKKARKENLEEFVYGNERYAVKVHPLYDASNAPDFNTAFRTSRNKGEKQFKWNNKVFTTDLVNKAISDNYAASKDFLSNYIKERQLSLSPEDSATHTLNGREFFGELRLNNDRHKATEDLNKKIYTSITQTNPAYNSGQTTTTGYYIPAINRLFSYQDPDDPRSITTHIHELTHKAGLIANSPISNTKDEYLSDPYERAARHIATEYYLNKKGVKYDKFGDKEYELLVNDKNLPYDIKQLVDLYKTKKEFIKHINTPLGYRKYSESESLRNEIATKAKEIKAKYGIQ